MVYIIRMMTARNCASYLPILQDQAVSLGLCVLQASIWLSEATNHTQKLVRRVVQQGNHEDDKTCVCRLLMSASPATRRRFASEAGAHKLPEAMNTSASCYLSCGAGNDRWVLAIGADL